MVVIRLARSGGRKRPFYHIHVADQRRSRDGRFIERLGFYDPLPRVPKAADAQQHIPERVRIDLDRLDYWVRQGAQMSDRVKKVVRDYKKAPEDKPPRATLETTADTTPEEMGAETTEDTSEETPVVAESTASPTDDEEVAA